MTDWQCHLLSCPGQLKNSQSSFWKIFSSTYQSNSSFSVYCSSICVGWESVMLQEEIILVWVCEGRSPAIQAEVQCRHEHQTIWVSAFCETICFFFDRASQSSFWRSARDWRHHRRYLEASIIPVGFCTGDLPPIQNTSCQYFPAKPFGEDNEMLCTGYSVR